MTTTTITAQVTPTTTDMDRGDARFNSPTMFLMRKTCSHCASGFTVLSGSMKGSSFCSSDCRSMDVYMKNSQESTPTYDSDDDDDEGADYVMINQVQYGMRRHHQRSAVPPRRMSCPVAIPQRSMQFVAENIEYFP